MNQALMRDRAYALSLLLLLSAWACDDVDPTQTPTDHATADLRRRPVARAALWRDAPDTYKRRWPSLSVEAGYPEGPYGLREGDIIADLTFEVGDGATWRLSEARGDGARLLMLITSAGWCSSCRQEQPKIQAIADAHARAGLRPIVAIFEDGDAQPATGDYAEAWRAQYEMSVPVVADPGFQLSPYFNPGGRSMFLLIDAETMAILRIDRDFHSARSEAEALAILARL